MHKRRKRLQKLRRLDALETRQGGEGADTFVRHGRRCPFKFIEADEIRDWQTNVDQLMMKWH